MICSSKQHGIFSKIALLLPPLMTNSSPFQEEKPVTLSLLPLSFSNCPIKNPTPPAPSPDINPRERERGERMSSTTAAAAGNNEALDQNVIVMRHGDRMDNFVPEWVTTADKPWDPPLFAAGKTRASAAGAELRSKLGFPIHRVFVSPFLRCIQTAAEVVSSLDPSKVKVSVEYGLCEMLSREAIRPELAPKDGDFRFNISELEAMLPSGSVDHSVERIFPEMPRWEETVLGARSRYEHVIQALADKYPSENLLLVTHGEGVGTSVSAFMKGATVYEVNYCGYSHLRRRVTFGEDNSFTAGNFQLLTVPGQTGVGYYTSSGLSDGV